MNGNNGWKADLLPTHYLRHNINQTYQISLLIHFLLESFTNFASMALREILSAATKDSAVDGLSTWVRWIMVGAIGLNPILIVWMARKIGWFIRHTRERACRLTAQMPIPQGL
jgi:hypothetical protein